ncbi:hypothetical protein GCM10027280_23210 [Micromonospora polyrhachis]|uniref:Uncharacterized protein n=1 Tax=Micromonospora polyrhachis TaxID=1282883 RepID=A0A7W7SXQ6_9ACTN|nr:hypothetical protein [Micromonospora polyrhachis]MBB4962546.1 hypothetical protein [Micromonospora polyrhachis]
MGIASRSVGRSAPRLLVGAVLAALLTMSTAGAALGDTSTTVPSSADSTIAAPTDVYIRDVAADVGLQPHSYNPLWASPDIKVCHTAVECAVSQNPIVGITNYIFVKLRNPGPYGSGLGNGTLRVYRTTPGGGATWPGAWTQIGAVSVPVPAGTTTVTIPWNGVPGPGHFCLLARWVSPTDPMVFEGPDISLNTRYNNNIAWRNVNSVNLFVGQPQVRPFAIGNSLTVATRNDLVFTPVGAPFQAAGGRIIADLGPTLFERWVAAGRPGEGIREVGRNQVEIVSQGSARINDLLLNPGERPEFSLIFTATAATTRPFTLHVNQAGPDKEGAAKTDLGGVEYQITVGQQG